MPLLHRFYFPLLQLVQANRSNYLFRKVHSLAKGYHFAFENFNNYDCALNGEFLLADKLHAMGNLNCVIDVGANIGEYSKMIRSICKKCQIVAFEPVPSTFEDLKKNTELLDIRIINCALGNFSGKAHINVVPNQSTLASLVEGLQEGGGRTSNDIEINVIKGSQFIYDSGIRRISLLKIDTEGYESEVLKGFEAAILNADVIQFEYGKGNLFSRYHLHDYFRDYSDRFYIGKLFPAGVLFHDEYDWSLDDHIGPNFVMVNRNRTDIKLEVSA